MGTTVDAFFDGIAGRVYFKAGQVPRLVLKARDPARAACLGTLHEQEPADLESRVAAELSGF